MRRCMGTIIAMKQLSGCVELTVAGRLPGSFAVDNLCLGMIVDCEGPNLIGRAVEYRDGHMRFLDTPEREDDVEPAVIPFPKPARSIPHF